MMKPYQRNLLALLMVLSLGLVACSGGDDAESGAQGEATDVPIVIDDFEVVADGRIVPLNDVNLSFEIGGQIAEVLVEEGDVISAGDVIARLTNVEQLEAAVSAAELELQAATLEKQSAALELLNAEKALSDLYEQFDVEDPSIQLQIAQLQDQIANARDALDDAEDDLEYYTDKESRDLEYYEDLVEAAEDRVEAATDAIDDAERGLLTAQQNTQIFEVGAQRDENTQLQTLEQTAALIELGPLQDLVRVAQDQLRHNREQLGNAEVAHNDNCREREEDDDLAPCRTTDAVHLGQSIEQWQTNVRDAETNLAEAELNLEKARQDNANAVAEAEIAAQEIQTSRDISRTNNSNAISDANDAIGDANEHLADMQEELAEARADLEAERNYVATDIRLSQTEADIEVAKAQIADAIHRIDELNAGPEADDVALVEARIETAKVRLATSESRLITGEANLAAAKANLADLELVAPIGGTVTNLSLKVGEQVAPGAPALTVADISDWVVETENLTEIEVPSVTVGQEVTIVPDALPDLELAGVVESIDNNFVERAGDITYTVNIKITESDPRLRWGMTVVVTFKE